MGDTGTISDKGKEKVTSPVRTRDFIKTQAQEKLKLEPRREFLKGGMNQGESSKQQDTTKQQNTTKQLDVTRRQATIEFNNALRTNTRLYGGNEEYARSQTRDAFSKEYSQVFETYKEYQRQNPTKLYDLTEKSSKE